MLLCTFGLEYDSHSFILAGSAFFCTRWCGICHSHPWLHHNLWNQFLSAFTFHCCW